MLSVWSELRSFIDLRGATLQVFCSSRIILTLAYCLYDEAEDRSNAIGVAHAIISSGRRARHSVFSDIEAESVQSSSATGGSKFEPK